MDDVKTRSFASCLFARLPICLLLTAYCLLPAITFSQIISATAKLDTGTIMIGQQTKLQLSVMYRVDGSAPGTKDYGQVRITWPTTKDTLITQVDVLAQSKIDTGIPNKSDPYLFQQIKTLTITSFDSGYFAIPPFRFMVNGDSLNYKETEPLLLQVNVPAVDTTAAIRDIKPPMTEPFQWAELIPYIAWGLAAAATIALVAFIAVKMSKKKPLVVPKVITPETPPHIIALRELEKLREQKLWQDGKIKQYHSSVTDILRAYIEGRFRVNALEQTTDEILLSFRSLVVDEDSKARLRQVLLLADLVKFAKEQPLANENELSMSNALAFVNGTLREEKTKETKETETAS